MLIEDAKVKELVYSGNTVIFLLPNRKCMRENSFFWSPSHLITLCSISSAFLIELAFFAAIQRVFRQINSFFRRIAFSARILSVNHSFQGLSTTVFFSGACLFSNSDKNDHTFQLLYSHQHTFDQLIQIFNYCIILYSPNCSDCYLFPNRVRTYTLQRCVKCSMIGNKV